MKDERGKELVGDTGGYGYKDCIESVRVDVMGGGSMTVKLNWTEFYPTSKEMIVIVVYGFDDGEDSEIIDCLNEKLTEINKRKKP